MSHLTAVELGGRDNKAKSGIDVRVEAWRVEDEDEGPWRFLGSAV